MIERYINNDGVKTRYISQGEGRPVLLVHGLGGFLESWRHNIPDLSKNFQVFALDLPGHGLSSRTYGTYSLKYIETFLIDFLRAMKLTGVNLIGHSAGGLICASLAIDHPELVDKLVLVDTAGLNRTIPGFFQIATIPVLNKLVMRLSTGAFIKYGTRRVFHDPTIIDQDLADLGYRYLKTPEVKNTFLNILSANAGITGLKPGMLLTSRLKEIRAPTLIIHGANDDVIPLDHLIETCSLIPRVKIEIFDECGHCPHLENIVRFNWLVSRFLNEKC
jgi:pimeloyl-ACP methyl ester carboxylesterase